MNLSFNLCVSQSAFKLASPIAIPIPIPNSKTRFSSLALPPSATQNPSGVCESRIHESMVNPGGCQKTQVQHLVDLLRECAGGGLVREAKAVHGFISKSNFADEGLLVLVNHLAHAYSKCSDLGSARKLFDGMSHRNAFSWTVMIVGSTDNGYFSDGFKFFCDMQSQGISPDKFAFSAVIQTCIGLNCVELGKIVHAQIAIRGFMSHIFVCISLLNMYAKLGKIKDSCQVFKSMADQSDVSWNAMISGLTSNGLYEEAFNHFLKMKREGFTPNEYTLISVLKAVGKLGDASKGKEVHNYVSELGMESNDVVGTALIDMYSKCGSLHDAKSVFDMNFTNCRVNAPWNAMISGYSQCECGQEALGHYVKMRQNNVKPDIYTHCSVFDAIAAVGSLQFGREVHGMVLKSGSASMGVTVNNAIADAYSKCGSLEDARKVFDLMKERDILSWTTLVTAYSQLSEGEEALFVFSQMREEGFTPNHFTFASVLVACAGLCFLEYGQQVHGLICKAGLHTDKCIESGLIDMYAKCGCLINARKVFKMISQPDVVSWTAIISGCAQHGFVDNALQLFRQMEQHGIKANTVTLLCVLFACSHGGLVDEALHYFQKMEENYGIVPEMEHYACIVDVIGRVGRLNEAMEFIEKMPIKPNDMVWQSLLGACRVHGNVELGEIAAREILSVSPEYSATYVLLSNTYVETGSVRDGLSMRNLMKERGMRKDPGYSWLLVNGKVHKFYAGDQHHPQKDDIYAKLEELREEINVVLGSC